jgi:adenylate cyclase
VSLEDLKKAVAEDRLALIPTERVLGGDATLSARQIAEQTGLDDEFLRVVWQALGMPRNDLDDVAYTEDDLEPAKRLKQFVDAGLPEDGIREVARVLGEGSSRLADATKSLIGEALIEPGLTELEISQRYAGAAEAMVPMAVRQMEHAYKLHMREQLRSDFLKQTELAEGRLERGEDVAVLFADLVGFTKLGEMLPPEDLRRVAGLLEDMATQATESGVKLVKTIGDAVMLVGKEPAPVVATALNLLDHAAEAGEEIPALRAGLAAGSALQRGGDWYGSPVNTASRVTGIARPGSVLATAPVRDATPDDFSWSAAGRRRLKGVKEPVALYRARRNNGDDADAG